MTNEEKMNRYMNRNVKLHPLLNSLTWDILFVWTISTMFFTTQKGLSYAQTISLDSILMVFGCILCLPVQRLFQNVKPTTAIRYGLIGYGGYLLLCVFGTNFLTFALAQFSLAFGYATCAVKINGVLTNSLNKINREKDYQKICGKGLSLYYIAECIGAIVITYIYSWNPYAAYWVSFGVVVFAILYTFLFKDPNKFQQTNVAIQSMEVTHKTNKKPDSYFKLLRSGFFICLLLYSMMFRGLTSITSSSYKIFLNQMVDANAIPVWLFGYLFAISRLVTALSSRYQFKFNLKFGVRSLILLNAMSILLFLGCGLCYLYNPTKLPIMIIIIIMCCINSSLRMPNQIFLNNYMQVCVSKRNIERAYAIRTMVEYLGYAVISALFAGLLTLFKDNWGLTNIVYIGIIAIPLLTTMIIFIRALCKKYAEKYTVIKDEYTEE